jgi:opacity protein-like surface antigen
MNKIFFSIIIFFVLGTSFSYAGDLEIGFEAGLATPSEKMNQIYNSNTLRWDKDSIANLINMGIDAGYHLGVVMQMPLNDFFSFSGHFGYNSFPESTIEVVDPNTQDVLATLYTTTRIIPFAAGLNFYPFKTVISPYATGEVSYNYISSSVTASNNIPVSSSPTDSRFGFGFGLGVDLNIKLLDVYLEGKYNYLNLIGKESEEPDKHYFTLVLGVIF